jgi:RimJ/RimL family protein N-acetyltransferase
MQGDRRAELAWVVGIEHQGRGIATEAAGAVVAWLRAVHRVGHFTASIRPDNLPSVRVAEHLGLRHSQGSVDDLEDLWEL